MTSAIDTLRAVARAAKPPKSARDCRILAETGLPVIEQATTDPVQAQVEAQLAPLVQAGDFAGLAEAFDTLFATRSFSGSGYRTYRVAQALLLASIESVSGGGEDAIRLALDRYRRWWRLDKTNPAAAACYARALLVAAHGPASSDGTHPIHVVFFDRLREHCREARRVLSHAGPRGKKHWLWRQADFTLTFVAWNADMEEDGALASTFTAVQRLDPHEFGIYDDRATHLLPHWSGSMQDIDAFARAAAKRTAAQFGDLLYARIYDTVLGYEESEETEVDPDRLMRAFGDWYELFPSQPLANRYAAHAHAFGDHVTLKALFRNAVREIHPAHWFDSEQPLEAWRTIAKPIRRNS